MSKTDETFVAAFPFEFKDQSESQFDGEQIVDLGMSLRDYFAARALSPLVTEALRLNHKSWAATAEHAYTIADAMMAEREK